MTNYSLHGASSDLSSPAFVRRNSSDFIMVHQGATASLNHVQSNSHSKRCSRHHRDDGEIIKEEEFGCAHSVASTEDTATLFLRGGCTDEEEACQQHYLLFSKSSCESLASSESSNGVHCSDFLVQQQ